MATSVQTNYTKFEGFLGEQAYFATSTPTAGDFHVWEMLDQHEMMASRAGLPSPLAQFPKLSAFYGRFRALPQLKGYFSSEAYAYDCNNRMANFLK